jgi:hypothetical protein
VTFSGGKIYQVKMTVTAASQNDLYEYIGLSVTCNKATRRSCGLSIRDFSVTPSGATPPESPSPTPTPGPDAWCSGIATAVTGRACNNLDLECPSQPGLSVAVTGGGDDLQCTVDGHPICLCNNGYVTNDPRCKINQQNFETDSLKCHRPNDASPSPTPTPTPSPTPTPTPTRECVGADLYLFFLI